MAVVYSAVAIVAYLIGFAPLSGVTAKDGVRASYTFVDPNLAGNSLVTSLFVMMAFALAFYSLFILYVYPVTNFAN